MQRLTSSLLAAAAGAGGAFLAIHHPIAPVGALGAFAAVAILAWRYALFGAWLLPAAIPLIALAPWSGAIAVEEVDLLALAVASGRYLSMAVHRDGSGKTQSVVLPAASIALLVGFAISWSVALIEGLGSLPPTDLNPFQGYFEPLNAVRIAKSAFLAALVVPALGIAGRNAAARIALAGGMSLGLLGASVAVLQERIAFTGLTNFSTDYRVTGPFWEMHVGGAALDGFLALTMPFALWLTTRTHRPLLLGILAVIVALGSYAALVTFSRGVYLALPVSIAVLVALRWRQRSKAGDAEPAGFVAAWILGALVVGAVALLVFRHGGYRALLAMLGVLAALLALAPAGRQLPGPAWLGGAAVGVAIGVIVVLGGPLLFKGPYVLYGLLFGACVVVAWAHPTGARATWMIVSGPLALAIAAVGVAAHWGGAPAARDAAIAVCVLLVLATWHSLRAHDRIAPRASTRLLAFLCAMGISGLVAVFSGGEYMSERMAQGRDDLDVRLRHWSTAVGMLSGTRDWLFGRGFGRFPESYVLQVPDGPIPGTYRTVQTGDDAYLALGGPRHPGSFGEMLKIGRWMPPIPGIYRIEFDARAAHPSELHVELCERHLLYNGTCAIARSIVGQEGRGWQHVELRLDARTLSPGSWYAPTRGFLAFAVETARGRIDLTRVRVVAPGGPERIENGDFQRGMAGWFLLSERLHLPWHAKSLAIDVLFEQGVVGLLTLAALVAVAVWRLSFGALRSDPLAPAITAGLAGFLVVGLFDSLLDAPRVALLFYLLVLLSVLSPPSRSSVSGRDG